MINQETIDEVKKRLVKTYNPIAIYLFGSYAWGKPNEDSDLDLMVVVDVSSEKSYARERVGHQALFGLDISKDLIVHTREVFERRADNSTTLEYKIKKEGRILYARA